MSLRYFHDEILSFSGVFIYNTVPTRAVDYLNVREADSDLL